MIKTFHIGCRHSRKRFGNKLGPDAAMISPGDHDCEIIIGANGSGEPARRHTIATLENSERCQVVELESVRQPGQI